MPCVSIILVLGLLFGNVDAILECGDAGNEQELEISEVSPQGSVLLTLEASYDSLQWTTSINGTTDNVLTSFMTSQKTGNNTYSLTLLKPLDLELLSMQGVINEMTLDEIDLSVTCRTAAGMAMTMTFHLIIRPVNEFHPVFIKAPYTQSVKEDAAVGTVIYSVKDKTMDMDFGTTVLTFGIAPYTISEFDGRDHVEMDDPLSGIVRLSTPVDFEAFRQRGRHYFFINVTVSDDGGLTSVTSINVTVQDVNDQGVEFVDPHCRTPCSNPNYTVFTNESYTGVVTVLPVAVTARDMDTLKAPLVYSLASATDERFFKIDRVSGELSKIRPLINDSYGYEIVLQVYAAERDFDAHFARANVTIYIMEREPKIGSSKELWNTCMQCTP